jgi:putative membrane protein
VKLIGRWILTIVALFAAAILVPGIHVEGTAWIAFAVMAIILGLVNAFVRPILKFVTCPLRILTLGLFTLVINGVTLYLAATITQGLGFGYYVDGFWPAFLGALIVSVVTLIGSALFKDDEDKKK